MGRSKKRKAFEAHYPNGDIHTMYEDGTGEGFPDGTITANYFIPLINHAWSTGYHEAANQKATSIVKDNQSRYEAAIRAALEIQDLKQTIRDNLTGLEVDKNQYDGKLATEAIRKIVASGDAHLQGHKNKQLNHSELIFKRARVQLQVKAKTLGRIAMMKIIKGAIR